MARLFVSRTTLAQDRPKGHLESRECRGPGSSFWFPGFRRAGGDDLMSSNPVTRRRRARRSRTGVEDLAVEFGFLDGGEPGPDRVPIGES